MEKKGLRLHDGGNRYYSPTGVLPSGGSLKGMDFLKKFISFMAIIFFFIAWSNDPNVNTPVCTVENAQKYPGIVADGFGGVIIAWQDNRAGHYDIYTQHMDVVGTPQWRKNGIPLCLLPGDQEYPEIVSDNSGGAIVVWQDKRKGSHYDIYAQHINAAGKPVWKAGGVGICVVSYDQVKPQIVSDGSGGAIIAWQDKRSGSHYDIYAQRIDAEGNIMWSPGGSAICSAGNDQYGHQLISDGNSGAILTWTDERRSHSDIYAQHIDAAGSLSWSAGGTAVCTAAKDQYEPRIVPKGQGGAIIAWFDKRDSYYYYDRYTIYAQHINLSGTAVWQENGVYVESEYSYAPEDLCMVPDGQGGAILSWTDYNCPYQVWVEVERIDGAGQSQWHTYATYYNEGYNARLLPTGSGGAIITWSDDRHGTNGNIRAQLIDDSGELQWGYYGIAVCSREGQQYGPRIVPDEAGGAIITWYDEDIYTQNVCDTGGLGDCVYPVAVMNRLRYGGVVPAAIDFDGSGSFDPDGTVNEWYWNFGDGETGTGKLLTHIYPEVGVYRAILRVRDNSGRWSPEVRAVVKTYALDNLEAKLSLSLPQVKARGKGTVQVNSACYEKNVDPGRKERPVPVELGLDYATTGGTWQDAMIFGAGFYSRTLVSGEPGIADIKAVLQGQVLGSIQVEFTWPRPPVNLEIDLKENRSFLRGEYFAYISWSANTQEIYTPRKYRIYRSTNNGAFELAGEVGASNFSYVDKSLPTGNRYDYALTMVDSEGDESDLSTVVQALPGGEARHAAATAKGKQGGKR